MCVCTCAQLPFLTSAHLSKFAIGKEVNVDYHRGYIVLPDALQDVHTVAGEFPMAARLVLFVPGRLGTMGPLPLLPQNWPFEVLGAWSSSAGRRNGANVNAASGDGFPEPLAIDQIAIGRNALSKRVASKRNSAPAHLAISESMIRY